MATGFSWIYTKSRGKIKIERKAARKRQII